MCRCIPAPNAGIASTGKNHETPGFPADRDGGFQRLGAHGAAARLEQAVRAEQICGAASGERRDKPLLLEAVMHIAAMKHRALDTRGRSVSEPRRPIGAEAAAPDRDAAAVDIAALQQRIEPGEEGALGGRIAVEHRVFAGARHVDGQRSEALRHHRFGDAQPVFLPAIDAAPMQYHRRPGRDRRPLQIAGERLARERQLCDLERWIEIARRLAEQTQRMPVGFELAGRIRRRIAADPAGVEGVHVELGKLGTRCARLGTGIGLLLIAEADLAPPPRPLILVEARQRIHHLLGILAADILERIEPPGAAQEFGLNLLE